MVVNVTSYCFHVCVTPEIRPVANVVAPLSLDDGLGLLEFRPGSSAYLAEISMTATV